MFSLQDSIVLGVKNNHRTQPILFGSIAKWHSHLHIVPQNIDDIHRIHHATRHRQTSVMPDSPAKVTLKYVVLMPAG